MTRQSGNNSPQFSNADVPAEGENVKDQPVKPENENEAVKRDGDADKREEENPGGLGYIQAPDGERIAVKDYPAYEKEKGF